MHPTDFGKRHFLGMLQNKEPMCQRGVPFVPAEPQLGHWAVRSTQMIYLRRSALRTSFKTWTNAPHHNTWTRMPGSLSATRPTREAAYCISCALGPRQAGRHPAPKAQGADSATGTPILSLPPSLQPTPQLISRLLLPPFHCPSNQVPPFVLGMHSKPISTRLERPSAQHRQSSHARRAHAHTHAHHRAHRP
jgi:hypothetical protein